MVKHHKLVNYLIILIMLLSPLFINASYVQAASDQKDIKPHNEAQNSVQLTIVVSEEEVPLPFSEIKIEEGDMVLDALINATEENDITLSYRGTGATAYVEGIDDIYEFDRGPGSGWMYRVNGVFPNRGAGVIPLVPGDVVEWLYTTDLGNDIGADLHPFRDHLDPTIHIDNLKDGSTVYDSKLSFAVEAVSYFGTALIPTVKVNDTVIVAEEGNHYSATLLKGQNIITIEVRDKQGYTSSLSLTITYDDKQVAPHLVEADKGDRGELDSALVVIQDAIEKASNHIIQNGVNSEWEAIGLAKAGKEIPSDYLTIFYQNIQDQVIRGLENGRIKITDIERLVMAAVAVGIDPRDIEGLDLIELIYNSPERRGGYDTMTFQGNNGPIFALIALDTQGFSVPEDAKWTRQRLIEELIRTQNEDGSWSLNSDFSTPSVDITGMALIGLSPYKDQPAVSSALDRAVQWLSNVQTEDGGFDGGDFVGGITSEAAAQVIIGLTAYGIDPTSEPFTKNGNNLITHLFEFQNTDGGFKHTMDYDYSDPMSTEQAMQALVAYKLFLRGEGSLYHFSDVIDNVDDPPGEQEEGTDEKELPEDKEEKTDDNEPPRDDLNNEEEFSKNPPSNNKDDTDNKQDMLHKEKKSDNTQTPKGKELPNTASNFYNYMLVGMLLMIIGGLVLFYLNRQPMRYR
ncbi:DUF4430 domain-containing protein [Ornithinibacillus sp. BX22]|uniref:DUF4430 domain-containing protein n=1 Tax=Ornithinibacillus hominis TaxID=2763055 RepID=A0A923RJX9_9BACI|nr:DUF4430 domain-containing protein [Ornithinibacillus hominis]MBC5636757.1 DUF4430 domain-containing protein [Ornithinibacillus hominis]